MSFEKPNNKPKPTIEGLNFDSMFPPLNDVGSEEKKFIDSIVEAAAEQIHDSVVHMLLNKDFFEGMPQSMRETEQLLPYVINSSRFAFLVHEARKRAWGGDFSGLLGDIVEIQGIETASGRIRRVEKGYRVNVQYLREIGIDPTKVLFFRRTDPSSDSSKPERYWTSDYNEVLSGLAVEIGSERRKETVVLVADLATVAEGSGGLVQDVNDDGGMSVSHIENNPFDQNRSMMILKNPRLHLE